MIQEGGAEFPNSTEFAIKICLPWAFSSMFQSVLDKLAVLLIEAKSSEFI